MSRTLNVLLRLDTKSFEAGMLRATRQVQAFGSKLENIGRDLSTRVSLPLGLIGAAAIKASGDMQQLRLSMNAISDSSEDAAKKFEILRKIALLPGIDLEQAIQGSIRLQSVGFSADEAAFSLQQLSKAVTLAGGSAQDLDEVTRQLTQIIGKGKLLSEDIKVILSRVPALGLAFRDAFGTTSIEAIRNSGISVQQFTSRLIQAISQNEKFQKVQGGINNALVNFQAAIKQSLAALGDEIVSTTRLDEVLTALAGTIQGAIEGFKSLSPETKRIIVVVGLLATAIGPLLIGIGALVKILPLAATGLRTFGVAGLATTAIVGGIALAFFQLVDELGSVEEAIAFVQAKFTAATAVITESIKRVFTLAKPGAKTAAQALGQSLGDVYNQAFTDSLRSSAFAAGRKDAAAQFDLPDAAKNFENLLAQAGGRAIDATSAVTATTTRPARPQVRELPALSGSAFGELAAQIDLSNIALLKSTTATDAAAASIEQVRASTAAWQEQVAAGIPLNIEADVLLEKQQKRFQAIANVLSGPIQEGFQGFFDTLLSGGQNAFKAFTQAIGQLIKKLISAVVTALALAAIFALISGGSNLALSKLGGVFTQFGGQGFKGLFKGFLGGGLGFAKGGLVTGPTAALIGEGPGTTRANPEVVAPLDKLQQILGNTQPTGFIASTRLDGNDLLILIERAERNRAR